MTAIKLTTPVYDLVTAHPEIIPVMVDMGLDGVTNPGLLNTVGRFMTLEKGARMKHIPIETIVAKVKAAGFEVEADE